MLKDLIALRHHRHLLAIFVCALVNVVLYICGTMLSITQTSLIHYAKCI